MKRTRRQKAAAKRFRGFQAMVRAAERRIAEGRANQRDRELIARLEAEGEREQSREFEQAANLAAFEYALSKD